ncbi:hypothetical protein Tco_0734913 [Tanacetum coccineum]
MTFGVQKHGGSKQVGLKKLSSIQLGFKQLGRKQVGFKQLGLGVETGVHGVQDKKRVWFEVELQGAQGDREAEVFQVSNDDFAVPQRRLEDKKPEVKTNTDCLVEEQENVHLGIKVGANIMVTGVPGQEGAEGLVNKAVPGSRFQHWMKMLSIEVRGIKVGANIMVTGVPRQEGAEGNVAEKKKVKKSMISNLGKLLNCKA